MADTGPVDQAMCAQRLLSILITGLENAHGELSWYAGGDAGAATRASELLRRVRDELEAVRRCVDELAVAVVQDRMEPHP